MCVFVSAAGKMGERFNNLGEGERTKQDCWKLLTYGEKILIFLLIFTFSLFLALFVLIVYLKLHARNICESPTCIRSSLKLLDRLDISTHPCENFAQFVCGTIPLTIDDPEKEAELEKLQIVSGAWTEQDTGSILAMKQFYQACINSSVIEQSGDSVLMKIIDGIGGWPLLLGQNWQHDETFHWLDYMTNLRESGLKNEWFISFNYYQDENGTNLLMIGPPTNIKQIKNYLKLVYYQTMVNVAIKLGSSSEFAWQELRKVSDFEHELSILVNKAQNRSFFDPKGNFIRITVDELNTLWPKVDLVQILNKLSHGFANFTKDNEIVLAVESYIYELNTLLQKTAKRTQANFLIWKIIEGFLPFSRDEIREQYEEYNSAIDSREDYCFKELTLRFSGALEAQYLNNYLNDDLLHSLKIMVNLIKDSIIDGEFSSPASEIIITGVETENTDIAEMEFTSNNILLMLNEVHFRTVNNFFACLHKNVSWCQHNGYFQRNPESEGSYFDVIQNAIILASKLLEPNWYNVNQPNYLNYARIGRTIGNVFKETVTKLQTNENVTKSGLDMAYEGYLRWIQLNGREKNLPGLNFTNKQIFWISSGRQFCDLDNNTNHFDEITTSQYFLQEFYC